MRVISAIVNFRADGKSKFWCNTWSLEETRNINTTGLKETGTYVPIRSSGGPDYVWIFQDIDIFTGKATTTFSQFFDKIRTKK